MTTQTDQLQGKPAERVLSLDPKQNVKGVSNFARSMRRLRKHRMAIFGAVLLLFIFLYVLIGSLLIPESARSSTIRAAPCSRPPPSIPSAQT